MTPQTSEFPAVADRARRLIHRLPAMRIVKFYRVTGGLHCRSLRMAEFATERRVDLVMADQAICHLREVRFRQRSGLLHAPMASRAGVRAIEMPADIARRRKIRF